MMKNIFLQLKTPSQIKKEPLLKLIGADEEEDKVPPVLEEYFENQAQHNNKDNALFTLQLIHQQEDHTAKEKLYALLVFFASQLTLQEAEQIVD